MHPTAPPASFAFLRGSTQPEVAFLEEQRRFGEYNSDVLGRQQESTLYNGMNLIDAVENNPQNNATLPHFQRPAVQQEWVRREGPLPTENLRQPGGAHQGMLCEPHRHGPAQGLTAFAQQPVAGVHPYMKPRGILYPNGGLPAAAHGRHLYSPEQEAAEAQRAPAVQNAQDAPPVSSPFHYEADPRVARGGAPGDGMFDQRQDQAVDCVGAHHEGQAEEPQQQHRNATGTRQSRKRPTSKYLGKLIDYDHSLWELQQKGHAQNTWETAPSAPSVAASQAFIGIQEAAPLAFNPEAFNASAAPIPTPMGEAADAGAQKMGQKDETEVFLLDRNIMPHKTKAAVYDAGADDAIVHEQDPHTASVGKAKKSVRFASDTKPDTQCTLPPVPVPAKRPAHGAVAAARAGAASATILHHRQVDIAESEPDPNMPEEKKNLLDVQARADTIAGPLRDGAKTTGSVSESVAAWEDAGSVATIGPPQTMSETPEAKSSCCSGSHIWLWVVLAVICATGASLGIYYGVLSLSTPTPSVAAANGHQVGFLTTRRDRNSTPTEAARTVQSPVDETSPVVALGPTLPHPPSSPPVSPILPASNGSAEGGSAPPAVRAPIVVSTQSTASQALPSTITAVRREPPVTTQQHREHEHSGGPDVALPVRAVLKGGADGSESVVADAQAPPLQQTILRKTADASTQKSAPKSRRGREAQGGPAADQRGDRGVEHATAQQPPSEPQAQLQQPSSNSVQAPARQDSRSEQEQFEVFLFVWSWMPLPVSSAQDM
ncbi:unnamed protein product, partial [Amoebophrya sp. A25]|eukprot:GSA25T00007555001.1